MAEVLPRGISFRPASVQHRALTRGASRLYSSLLPSPWPGQAAQIVARSLTCISPGLSAPNGYEHGFSQADGREDGREDEAGTVAGSRDIVGLEFAQEVDSQEVNGRESTSTRCVPLTFRIWSVDVDPLQFPTRVLVVEDATTTIVPRARSIGFALAQSRYVRSESTKSRRTC